MLLNQLQQVVDIDSDIEELHKELAQLYSYRRNIISQENVALPPRQTTGRKTTGARIKHAPAEFISSTWEEEQYKQFASLWAAFGVTIPSYQKLAKKLSKAKELINEQLLQDEEFELLIVPPSTKVDLKHPIIASNAIMFSDSVATMLDTARVWKVYIVAVAPIRYAIDALEDYSSKNDFVLNGYRMPGLSIREYAILLATKPQAIDKDSWSLIVRNVNVPAKLVPCVAYIGGHYKFETDYTDALMGENHFRPAMEVK